MPAISPPANVLHAETDRASSLASAQAMLPRIHQEELAKQPQNDLCPQCNGTRFISGYSCPYCGGSGYCCRSITSRIPRPRLND